MVHNGVTKPCWLSEFYGKWPLWKTVFSNCFIDFTEIFNLIVVLSKEMPFQTVIVHWIPISKVQISKK